MIFVIPVSGADFDKFPKFVEVLKKFSGLRGHSAILLPTQAVSEGVRRMARPLGELFEKCEIVPVPTPEPGPWPYPCNQHFKSAVEFVGRTMDKPWMWMEIDSCPLKENWADLLQSQYYSAGKPFMGVVRDSADVTLEGDGSALDGSYLVGFGIYPKDFPRYTNLWNFPAKQMPFDVLMRYDVAKFAHHTNLIQHESGSIRYYKNDSGIFGSSKVGSTIHVKSDAVILHGVKDDSLYDIILGKNHQLEPRPLLSVVSDSKAAAPEFTLEDAKQMLIKAGCIILDPDNPSQSTETISTADVTNGVQGEPATGFTYLPHETKSNAEVKLAKKRGRPKLVK